MLCNLRLDVEDIVRLGDSDSRNGVSFWTRTSDSLNALYVASVAVPLSNVKAGSSQAPVPQEEVYTVVAGDSLSKIAKRSYGDANQWRRIFEANRDQIKNPDLIQPGWKLRIPKP